MLKLFVASFGAKLSLKGNPMGFNALIKVSTHFRMFFKFLCPEYILNGLVCNNFR